jgi:alpha-galactosidase
MHLKAVALAACLAAVPAVLIAQTTPADSTLAATPPMGWNSWNHFAGKVTDADVRAAADALVSTGMRDAGYIYVNIDDTWEAKTRDAQGNIRTNEKFPDMKALADYVHSKGLKLGIYSSPGPYTCAHYLGSYKHEKQDAATYAAWGIDYLKYDMCSYGNIIEKKYGKPSAKNTAGRLAMDEEAYEKMHQALVATGRPIVFSMCQYGWDDVWKWGASVGGNLWRTTGDIDDTYIRMSEIGFSQAGLGKFAGPGHWNDPDMLEVGNGGMTTDEYKTHMSLWAILAAPLLAGNDLSKVSPADLAILTNKEVIAIDQDPLGKQGDRVWTEGFSEIWSKPLTGGAQAVAIFNRASEEKQIPFKLSQVGAPDTATLHDIWAAADVTATAGAYLASVPAHGVVLLRVGQ